MITGRVLLLNFSYEPLGTIGVAAGDLYVVFGQINGLKKTMAKMFCIRLRRRCPCVGRASQKLRSRQTSPAGNDD